MIPFRMRVRHIPLGVIALALPLAVEVEVPQDSSVTQIRVAGGGGRYVALMRDCNGGVTDKAGGDFYDFAAGIDHKFGGHPFTIGLSGGYLHDEYFPGDSTTYGGPVDPITVPLLKPDGGYYYVTPSIGFMWRRFGISLGATYFSRKLLNPNDVDFTYTSVPYATFENTGPEWLPSAAIRIGPASDVHFTMSALSAFPMYSGGGYFDMMFGGPVSDRASLMLGVGFAGMTATGFETRLQWRLTDRLYLDGTGTVGQREGENQYSGSMGVTYRVVH